MLTNDQQKELHQSLLDRLDEIEAEQRNEKQHDQNARTELSTYDNHPADSGTELFEREKDMALHTHLEKEKNDILTALQRIETGQYGRCEISGKAIPFERLQAIPTATTIRDAEKHNQPASDRPVEEDNLSPSRTYFPQHDGEDAWQVVEAYGTSDTPADLFDPDIYDYDSMTLYQDEQEGAVEAYETFTASKSIDGSGKRAVPSRSHEAYEQSIDDNHSD
ncbi:TraR/DksA family transcriptional regulator [Aureibacillus halotolerans]|uniref:TraR/DksA family transcriptional regulator n=2 Tax=Aureibacillus halotolerans TaxID=1508390 RepID=A0A4R6U6J4_9BACI|nr:TraR/DksA family transcriptional regulator [Aureibacillus halotolerans]